MVQLVERRTGNWVEIPDEALLPALKSREYTIPGTEVRVVAPNGKIGYVPQKLLIPALEGMGMKLWSPEAEFAGVKGATLAAMLGAGRGATWNLLDAALVKMDGADPDIIRNAEKAHPGITALTEAGSMVGSALLSGGATMLPGAISARAGTRAAEKVGTTIAETLAERGTTAGAALLKEATVAGAPSFLSKVVGKAIGDAAGAGVDMLPYIAGEAVSEKALGDPRELGDMLAGMATTEGLVMALGAGLGWTGAIFGTAARAMYERGGKLADRWTKSVAEGLAKGEARDAATLKAIGASEAEAVKISQNRNLAKDLMHAEGIHPDGGSIMGGAKTEAEVAARLKVAVDSAGKTIADVKAQLEPFSTMTGDDAILFAGDDVVDVAKRWATKFRGETRLDPDKRALLDIAIAKVEKDYRGKLFDWKAMFREQGGLSDAGFGEAGTMTAAEGTVKSYYSQIGQELKLWMREKARTVLPENTMNAWERADVVYHNLNDLSVIAQKSAAKGKNTIFSDIVKFINESAGRGASRTAYGLMATMGGAAGIGGLVGGVPGALFGGIASGVGAAGLGIAYRKLTPGPVWIANTAHKLMRAETLATRVTAGRTAIDNAVKSFVGAAGKVGRPAKTAIVALPVLMKLQEQTGERDVRKVARKVEAQIAQMALDPGHMANVTKNVTFGMQDIAPETSLHVGAALTRAAQYLHQQAGMLIPKNPSLQPMVEDQESLPALNEAHNYLRTVGAVLDPTSVIDKIGRGVALPDEIDALRAVYPAIFAALQVRLMKEVGQMRLRLVGGKRQNYADVLGGAPDVQTSPDFVLSCQQSWNAVESGSGVGGVQLPPPGVFKPSAATTSVDRIEQGRSK